MVNKIDFNQKYDQLVKYLSGTVEPVLDPEVMIHLGFSPPSWKTWKSQFISMAEKPIKIERDDDNRITGIFYVRYSKKSKSWSIDQEKTVFSEQ